MRKALFTLVCMFAMMAAGTGLKAQEVTITLLPGVTWIGIPGMEAQDFATALGSFTPADGDVIKSQWGSVIYRNGQWKGSISQFYPGYGYIYKSNRTVPVTLTFNAQQPAPQVVVTTSEPMLVTAISAMGGGEVTTDNGVFILAKGLCWATHENPTTNDDFYQEAESGVGSFSLSMTNLNISTTYYVRAYAVTGDRTYYGDQKTFTTRDGIPTLMTTDITNITAISATSGGNITDNGGLNITARGVCWSTSPNPTISGSNTTNGTGSGSYTSGITGLDVSTTYYVRAYATTNAGTAYGNEVSFTTRDGIPTLTTTDVTGISGEMAWSGGNITDDEGLSVIARGVCWSTSPNPTVNDSHTTNGTGTGVFYSYITGLDVNTIYYVRAYATTPAGAGYGEQKTFTTRDGIPEVNTAAITSIANTNAMCGGTVTDNGGLSVIARGVCWNTTHTPTINDCHTTNGSGLGTFICSMTGLTSNTTYYVRAYASTTYGTGYGEEMSFSTIDDLHDFVDLGLPSGTLWATCNVGADNPEDNGSYFAWGETQPKGVYNWSTYQYCNGSSTTLTKYCGNSNYGYNGFTDDLITLLPEDDVATANWGEGWRMPTKEEWQELYNLTTSIMTTLNGVYGRLFTATNGNSLFIPAAGYRNNSGLSENGVAGDYLSSSLYTSIPNRAWEFNFGENNYGVSSYGHRKLGLSVRAVRSGSASQNSDYVDLGLPSGTLWATYNLGAVNYFDTGDTFAWGEIQPKSYYSWGNYQHCHGSDHDLTKYCFDPAYGYNGYTDTLITLLPEDDAAAAILGGNWRMPTYMEWDELCANTSITVNPNGLLFVATNGNYLFLPILFRQTEMGIRAMTSYWSSTLICYGYGHLFPDCATGMDYYIGDELFDNGFFPRDQVRAYDSSIRPVRSDTKIF